jgi:hypothetical protein
MLQMVGDETLSLQQCLGVVLMKLMAYGELPGDVKMR